MSFNINIIVWGYHKDLAKKAFIEVLGFDSEENFAVITYESHSISVYLRYFGQEDKQSPKELTDILLLNVDESTVGLGKEYIDTRRGVPLKFISGYEINPEEAEYIADIKLGREKIFTSAIGHIKALYEVFNKIDSNQNGFLDRDEIIKASKELNHDLLEGDANEIVAILGKEGKIDFKSFRHWWQLGRFDFSSFRALVSMKIKVTNFLDKNLAHFNSFLNSFNTNASEEHPSDSLHGKFSIVPIKDQDRSDHKTSINFHVTLGEEYDNIKHTFPLYYNEAATLSIEIPLRNCEANEDALKSVTNFVKGFLQDIQPLSSLFKHGVQINSRLQGNIAVIDLSLGGSIGDFIIHIAKTLNLGSIKYSGHIDSHISTKVSITSLFEDRERVLGDLVKEVLKIIIEKKGDIVGIKLFIKVVFELLNTFIPENEKITQVKMFYNALSIIKNFNFSFDYAPDELYSLIPEEIRETVMKMPLSQIFEQFYSVYDTLGDNEVFKQIVEILAKHDLDNISIVVTTPVLRVILKATILVLGLNSVIDKTSLTCSN